LTSLRTIESEHAQAKAAALFEALKNLRFLILAFLVLSTTPCLETFLQRTTMSISLNCHMLPSDCRAISPMRSLWQSPTRSLAPLHSASVVLFSALQYHSMRHWPTFSSRVTHGNRPSRRSCLTTAVGYSIVLQVRSLRSRYLCVLCRRNLSQNVVD
jgi:hypothetical protein